MKREEECPFDFILPEAPYSFKGELFSIEWMRELVMIPFGNKEQLDIVVSPISGVIIAEYNKKARDNRNESEFVNIRINSPLKEN